MARDTEITILARNGTGADVWKLLTEQFEVVIVRRTHSEDGETAILSLAITGKKRKGDTDMTEITYRQEGDLFAAQPYSTGEPEHRHLG